jgi:acyl-CoA synthetase (AMP-forming)/AMP-acid ligase II
MNQGLTDFLLAGKDPGQTALAALDREHSYGELRSSANAIAAYLLSRGGRKGDRVVLIAENSFFWVASYLGTLQAGLISVPLPLTVPLIDLVHILQSTEPAFVIFEERFALRNRDWDQIQLITDRPASGGPGAAGAANFTAIISGTSGMSATPPPIAQHDLAALMFTSGSTGKPRGVMVSHGNLMANAESILAYLGLTARDRMMTVLPFHYCFGASLLHTHLRVGASLVLEPRFMYPEKVLDRMQTTQCTGLAGVPSHFQILLRRSSLGKRNFPHLRHVQQAGGRLPSVLLKELSAALPQARIFVMYGQTEATARLSYLDPEFLDKKPGSIGKAIPGVGLRVLNEAGQEVSAGQVGEIVAEGPNIAHGYWHSPEESATTFRNGKLYTGDLATVDEDGFIYIVDRAKDFLKCGGRRVSCQQLEEQLLRFEGLLEAAVVGMPDELLGEAVKAFVVPIKPCPAAELEERLRSFCKKSFSFQLVPKEIVVLSSLPKNSAGKVLKQQLRQVSRASL